ncbi:MAG: Bro-N domain-containing protein [Bacteroidaceae bacterium]|nr:Bro-N domain-containing protein [Bacteroidaceae bacterium]
MCKDVAEALGYKNPHKAVQEHVDAEDKGVKNRYTLLFYHCIRMRAASMRRKIKRRKVKPQREEPP